MKLILLCTLAAYATVASADFGLKTDSSSYTVDAGSAQAPLVYKVSRSTCDITSILYRGRQLQQPGPYSHINSGLGSGTSVTATTIGGKYTKITCTKDSVTHYYITRSGEATIYMATHITALPTIGELRFIARLKSSELPSATYTGATTAGATSTVEGKDVFVVDRQTRSKFYSSERFIDDEVHCVWGSKARVCMVIPGPTGYETSSGGPFMRDINTNMGGTRNDLYWYMNSGHVRTEPVRTGLMGPYAMAFSDPAGSYKSIDTSFFSELSISDYVPVSGRGYVSGSVAGIQSGFRGVVHWFNPTAQYWTYASDSFTSPPMKPGTYTMVLYKNELKVATSSVTVSAGATTSYGTITSKEDVRDTVWRIGEFDGTPVGLKNAANQLRMHPTDSRMVSWAPTTFIIGSNIASDFPMAQVSAVNDPTTIRFSNPDTSGTFRLRIGTTLSFTGGRPKVSVNNWTGATPAAPVKIDSRGLTRGAYRGYGEVYEWTLPAGTVVNGANEVRIGTASGSSGVGFLSPNFIYDAVELYKV